MIKQISVSFFIALLLGIVLFASAQYLIDTVTKGDVNGDGEINILDALGTVNIILVIIIEPSEDQICAADVNGDGQVNVLDVLLIVNVILDPDDFRFVSSCDELDCDDNNACTQDYCDSSCVQCRHIELSSGTPCDDGDHCTENDQCVDGTCQGTPINCDDGDPCTDDSCDPLTGECDFTAKDCDDDNPCTEDSCDPDSGCIYEEICCDNGIDDDRDGYPDCNDGDCLVDIDGDGYYAEPCGDDCNDTDATIYSGAGEICGDGKDNDCDGDVDYYDDDCSCEAVTDIDGNIYQTIVIGNQCWMTENLKVTHYSNGDPIPNVIDNNEWGGLSIGAYCSYDNDESNISTYGLLYNWFAVNDSRNIAPEGWHVPSDEEWQTLVDYLGSEPVAGGKMKEVGTTHWSNPNTGATNESGFTALPGGHRSGLEGSFDDLGGFAFFWSYTEYGSSAAWFRLLTYWSSEITRNFYFKQMGFSVRCVRNQVCPESI